MSAGVFTISYHLPESGEAVRVATLRGTMADAKGYAARWSQATGGWVRVTDMMPLRLRGEWVRMP